MSFVLHIYVREEFFRIWPKQHNALNTKADSERTYVLLDKTLKGFTKTQNNAIMTTWWVLSWKVTSFFFFKRCNLYLNIWTDCIKCIHQIIMKCLLNKTHIYQLMTGKIVLSQHWKTNCSHEGDFAYISFVVVVVSIYLWSHISDI